MKPDLQDLYARIRAGDIAAVNADLRKRSGIHSASNENAVTPLHVAARSKQLEIAKTLISLGAPVDARDLSGSTPLLNSVYAGSNADMVELLLECGANVHARDNEGYTAIFCAREVAIANALIRHGAEVNVTSSLSDTPLGCQCGPHSMSAVHTLLSAGADPNKADAKGRTPLHITTSHQPLFFDRPQVLRVAEESTRLLLEFGANPNSRNAHGWTPLHLAAHFGRVALVRILIASGADTRARTDRGLLPEDCCMRANFEGWGDATEALKRKK